MAETSRHAHRKTSSPENPAGLFSCAVYSAAPRRKAEMLQTSGIHLAHIAHARKVTKNKDFAKSCRNSIKLLMTCGFARWKGEWYVESNGVLVAKHIGRDHIDACSGIFRCDCKRSGSNLPGCLCNHVSGCPGFRDCTLQADGEMPASRSKRSTAFTYCHTPGT
jgi:hypothetical protein